MALASLRTDSLLGQSVTLAGPKAWTVSEVSNAGLVSAPTQAGFQQTVISSACLNAQHKTVISSACLNAQHKPVALKR